MTPTIVILFGACLAFNGDLLAIPVPAYYNQAAAVRLNQVAIGALSWFFNRGPYSKSAKDLPSAPCSSPCSIAYL